MGPDHARRLSLTVEPEGSGSRPRARRENGASLGQISRKLQVLPQLEAELGRPTAKAIRRSALLAQCAGQLASIPREKQLGELRREEL